MKIKLASRTQPACTSSRPIHSGSPRAAAALRPRTPTVLAVLAALATIITAYGAPTSAHHVGAYTPRDNEISANFKQLKFSLEARKFEVALRLYDEGALRKELRARSGALPAGLDDRLRAALQRGDVPDAEAGLMVFVLALARDLALEADRQVAAASADARAAVGRKFLEAIWRYYNLVDFLVTQRNARAATTVRLAFDEAEGYVKTTPPVPERLSEPLRRIVHALTGVIEASSPSARRDSS